MLLKINERLHYHGFFLGVLKQSDSLRKVLEFSNSFLEGAPVDGFTLEEKYKDTLDVKPDVIYSQPYFVNILKENFILDIIEENIGIEYSLSAIQVRLAKDSYMPWHRDSYMYDGVCVGKTPPGYKMIIYPNREQSAPRLGLIPGSHLQQKYTPEQDTSQVFSESPIQIMSGNDRYVFFNTSLVHGTLDNDEEESVRIIYNFAKPNQMDEEETSTCRKFRELL